MLSQVQKVLTVWYLIKNKTTLTFYLTRIYWSDQFSVSDTDYDTSHTCYISITRKSSFWDNGSTSASFWTHLWLLNDADGWARSNQFACNLVHVFVEGQQVSGKRKRSLTSQTICRSVLTGHEPRCRCNLIMKSLVIKVS